MKRLFLLCLAFFNFSFGGNPDLEIFDGNYPISFYFRQTEGLAARRSISYKEWADGFSQLNGVMGKMLDEEVLGRSASQEYYRRFKKEHPRQAVLLHVNGGFRKPLADISGYHDGHWLYYNGTRVLDSISDIEARITIRVSDVSVFQLRPYRNNPDLPDDLGLCSLNEDGLPNWNHAEQARLLDIDENRNTITIERGAYGDKEHHAYQTGEAYVAAHVAQNWGTTNKLWEFNMATTCPRDKNGKQAADVWAGELIGAIRPGGEIDYVDGFQFDVPFIRPISLGWNRRPDANVDGKPDYGIVDGQPVFAHGVERFFRILREAFPDKLIMADSGGKSQRSLKYLNGMETEGWPELKDTEFNYWSRAINYHRFWSTRAHEPIFHYGLMKYLRWPRNPYMSDSRMIMAGTTLFGAAVPFGGIPDRQPDLVLDELVGGRLKKKGWLGKPLGPARRLALSKPNLFSDRWLSSKGRIKRTNGTTNISSRDEYADELHFRLENIRHNTVGDVVLAVTIAAEPRAGYPKGNYREMSVEISGSKVMPDHLSSKHFVTPVDEVPFQAVFYMRDVPRGDFDLSFTVEGGESVEILDVSIHETADVVVREFENGAILVNPSRKRHLFNLEGLFPRQKFKRLKATRGQDSIVNNGKAIGGTIEIPALDALFLLKQ